MASERAAALAAVRPGGRSALPTGDLAAVAARHMREHLAHVRGGGGSGDLSRRQSQFPLPATRSTVIRMTYPGGGSSMGGNLTSGPM